MVKIVSFLTLITLLIASVFFNSPSLILAAMSSSNYQIWQDAISVGGGEDQTSTNYTLKDTLGELAIDRSSSTNYGLKPGFREVQFFSGLETLSFSVSPSSLEFGKLDKDSTGIGSVTLIVNTNSYTGVSVTYGGATLTCTGTCVGSGPSQVSAIGSSAAASSKGTSQFGFNVIYTSGTSPVASAVSPYNGAGTYAFNGGDQIISSSSQINETIFSLNFIANISGDEKGGNYSTTLTYTATANF